MNKMRSFLIVLALLITNVGLAESPELVEAVEQSRPMYERFGMTSTQLFILMVSVTILLSAVLISLALNTGKIIQYWGKNKINKGKNLILLLIGLFVSSSSFAKEPYEQAEMVIPFSDTSFWILVTFDICLVLMILYISGVMNKMLYDFVPKRESRFLKNFKRSMVDATPIDQEASILLDHDYDGIKELDNNLPPWWKWGFYVTIVWGACYFTYYSVLGGETQHEEFMASVEEGEREVAEYKAAHPELVDENTTQMLTDASTISQGKSIFTEKCVTCHKEGGAGEAGPNLTDDYWIYGNDPKTLFHTISEGANNGMRSWKDELNGIEIQAVASYILQLEPILPPMGQEPKGDYYEPYVPEPIDE